MKALPPNGKINCPGCGLLLPLSQGLPSPLFNSSPECWALYGELSAFTLTLNDPAFPHQHAVDAYTAQHIGPATKPIAAVFALVGICLALEQGASGREAQLAHMALAKTRRDWPVLAPRAQAFGITVADVLAVGGREERLGKLRVWMDSTWQAWAHEQERIREIVRALRYNHG